jgi:Cu2+-exporting ATPase
MVGIGLGAEHGILIKDAESLEAAKTIDTIVLDKTGTITEGKPAVTDIAWLNGKTSRASILLSLESQSEHPLAQAIVNYFTINEFDHSTTKDTKTMKEFGSLASQEHDEASEPLSAQKIQDFESISGKGARGSFDGETYWVGNLGLLRENQIKTDAALVKRADGWAKEVKTVIWFANNTQALAIMAIADKIKDTSIDAIRQLKAMGIEVYMITGDNNATAEAIARQTGITEYQAEVLPQQKSDIVSALQAQGKTVAMVGDGINDSAALAQADVSIAMGRGSDIAMEVAKMTITSSDLKRIPTAIALSKHTVATIRQNLFWAFIYNMIGIPIAAGVLFPFNGFLLNPMIAGAAMALSSVSVVGNSLRLRWRRI